jgi:hypothetical protein
MDLNSKYPLGIYAKIPAQNHHHNPNRIRRQFIVANIV